MIRYIRKKKEGLEIVEELKDLDGFEVGEEMIWIDVVKPGSWTDRPGRGPGRRRAITDPTAF